MMRGSPLRRPWLSLHVLLLSAVVLTPSTGYAQQALPLAPGTRVRVRAVNLVAPLIANFLQMRGDTAVFIEDAAGRGIWSFAVSDITRLERSDGERKANKEFVVRGAIIGGGVGALAGLGIAATLEPSDKTKKYNHLLTAGAGAVVGAVIGGAIGSRRGSERWTSVPVPRRVSLLPEGKGVGLRLSFDF